MVLLRGKLPAHFRESGNPVLKRKSLGPRLRGDERLSAAIEPQAWQESLRANPVPKPPVLRIIYATKSGALASQL
jgi:hypothetical protein